MLFDMVWTKANFVNNEVIVDVNGFDVKKSYVCEYVDEANSKIKKITDSKFLDNNKYKLNCGKQPTGFTIKLTSQRVKLSIKLKASTRQSTLHTLAAGLLCVCGVRVVVVWWWCWCVCVCVCVCVELLLTLSLLLLLLGEVIGPNIVAW